MFLGNAWDILGDDKLGKVKCTNTIKFILLHGVLSGTGVVYRNFACNHHPLKTEPLRVQLIVGDDASSPASGLIDEN